MIQSFNSNANDHQVIFLQKIKYQADSPETVEIVFPNSVPVSRNNVGKPKYFYIFKTLSSNSFIFPHVPNGKYFFDYPDNVKYRVSEMQKLTTVPKMEMSRRRSVASRAK